jgi:hypothetical protein
MCSLQRQTFSFARLICVPRGNMFFPPGRIRPLMLDARRRDVPGFRAATAPGIQVGGWTRGDDQLAAFRCYIWSLH